MSSERPGGYSARRVESARGTDFAERSRALAAVARGDADADLLFTGGRVVNVFTGEVERTNVAIHAGRVAGLGDYHRARTVVDLGGRYLVPGLIDGHVHVESSMLVFPQYARAVVPHGTLGIVTDLHEIANVAGLAGFRAMVEHSRGLPLDSFFLAPSCVPSSPLESAGATVTADDIADLLADGTAIGLGEVMDAAGVIAGDSLVHEKLAVTRGVGRTDGHGPGLAGLPLNAYLGAGPASDHECTTPEEALEKLRRGAYLMIRQGSSERNLDDLLPLVGDRVRHRCMLVVDDRSPGDLVLDGDLDAIVRRCVALGTEPVAAIQMASINPATYFGLAGLGAIAPGYWANLLVVDDLADFRPREVFYRGALVARDGVAIFPVGRDALSGGLADSLHLAPIGADDLSPLVRADRSVPVIEIVAGQIITRFGHDMPPVANGRLVADAGRDLLKLVVVERHRATGNLGVGLVRGFGLQRGAFATSLAHDAHNVVAVGASDSDIRLAVGEIARTRGGLACVADGRVLASLPLPIAGLLSPKPVESVAAATARLDSAVAALGCGVPAPFSVLSFLALPSIPELRLTDRGLVDVAAGRLLEVLAPEPSAGTGS